SAADRGRVQPEPVRTVVRQRIPARPAAVAAPPGDTDPDRGRRHHLPGIGHAQLAPGTATEPCRTRRSARLSEYRRVSDGLERVRVPRTTHSAQGGASRRTGRPVPLDAGRRIAGTSAASISRIEFSLSTEETSMPLVTRVTDLIGRTPLFELAATATGT